MQIEEGRFAAMSLNSGQTHPRTCFLFACESLCQMFYGWFAQESGKGELLPTYLLNAVEQAYGKKRMPSQVEKVIANPDGLPVQKLFPDLYELLLNECG
jgi:hypothetical protein